MQVVRPKLMRGKQFLKKAFENGKLEGREMKGKGDAVATTLNEFDAAIVVCASNGCNIEKRSVPHQPPNPPHASRPSS